MTVSYCHFKPTVTWSAKSNKIADYIRFVLIVIIAAWVNMVNIELAPAWAFACAASFANLISFVYSRPYLVPVSTMLKALTAAPVCAILASHVKNGAFSRAILSPVFYLRWKRLKLFSAIQAIQDSVLFLRLALTLSRTKLCIRFSVKSITARLADYMIGVFNSPIGLTLARAKSIFCFFACSPSRAFKFFSAIITRMELTVDYH